MDEASQTQKKKKGQRMMFILSWAEAGIQILSIIFGIFLVCIYQFYFERKHRRKKILGGVLLCLGTLIFLPIYWLLLMNV